MLIEDDDGYARLVEKNLCRSGLCDMVIPVDNGREGLDIINGEHGFPRFGRSQPLRVLLDLNMPVLDGYGVLPGLKGNPDTRAIPVIVMTTATDAHEIRRRYEMGANLYLWKPVDYAKFQQMVSALGELLKVIAVPVSDRR